MKENVYQAGLIKRLHARFPGCVILKNDTNYTQGIPDLVILYRNKWAVFEVKSTAEAPTQPNQEYYVDLLNGMSFANFIYPENEEDVLNDLQQTFNVRRPARVSKRK